MPSRQGHYAGVDRSVPGRTRLIRSIDPIKDQTYYLSSVAESKLSQVGSVHRRDRDHSSSRLITSLLPLKAIFPLSNLLKSQVRELARRYDLPTASRAESMGVCFIGERGRFGDFVCTSAIRPRAPRCLLGLTWPASSSIRLDRGR
jgi:tRNA-specific 2-thiouridylase